MKTLLALTIVGTAAAAIQAFTPTTPAREEQSGFWLPTLVHPLTGAAHLRPFACPSAREPIPVIAPTGACAISRQ